MASNLWTNIYPVMFQVTKIQKGRKNTRDCQEEQVRLPSHKQRMFLSHKTESRLCFIHTSMCACINLNSTYIFSFKYIKYIKTLLCCQNLRLILLPGLFCLFCLNWLARCATYSLFRDESPRKAPGSIVLIRLFLRSLWRKIKT